MSEGRRESEEIYRQKESVEMKSGEREREMKMKSDRAEGAREDVKEIERMGEQGGGNEDRD